MAYIQVVLLLAGLLMVLGHFGDNHLNMSNGTSHYAWFHPRFLALTVTALSASWLLVWPIIASFGQEPLRALLVCTAIALLFVIGSRWLTGLQRLALGIILVPCASLLLGGMPAEASWSANLAILSIAPTLYILHHKKDDRLRDIITRHDILAAYVVWTAAHLSAYWPLVGGGFQIVGPSLLWIWHHTRIIGLSFVWTLMVLAVGWALLWVTRKTSAIRSSNKRPSVRPSDQQAPHFIIE